MNIGMILGGLVGGVGLFLLGMGLMTDGLKLAAGPALERILARSTRTRWRGLLSGILITALVQSSSAVTVAAIGFVNAGLLNLSQALWVLFGTNVGTTMTGWLVAVVGLEFKIDAMALPMIGLGMILRLTGEGGRRGALGMALAGIGVLFLGIDMLRATFSGLSSAFTLPQGTGVVDVVLQVVVGMILTVLMQSSSASLAVALTAAQGGLLTLEGAAAVAIGANIGTTVKAMLASIGATPNARRAAAAHILFNVLTGVVALAILPWLLTGIELISRLLALESSPAAKLALFHTVFNVLGVILIWPLANRLTVFLEHRFRRSEDDEALPRHLDGTVLAVPALALEALESEVRRAGGMAIRLFREALAKNARPQEMSRIQVGVSRLNQAIADFIVRLNRSGMSAESAVRLPRVLRTSRYYEAVAELSVEAAAAMGEADGFAGPEATENLETAYAAFRERTLALLALCDPAEKMFSPDTFDQAGREAEEAYQNLKAQLLEAGAAGGLPAVAMDARLRAASALHRAKDQAIKGARMLAAGMAPPATNERNGKQ